MERHSVEHVCSIPQSIGGIGKSALDVYHGLSRLELGHFDLIGSDLATWACPFPIAPCLLFSSCLPEA